MSAKQVRVRTAASATEPDVSPEDVLASKIEPPRQRSALLVRRGLLEQLFRRLDKRLILISAPAGYGKSSLLTQLYGHLQAAGKNVAWLGVDAADNDPVRFARHCLAALAVHGSLRRTGAQDLLEAASARHGLASGLSEAVALGTLRSAFERLTVDTYLFLDDVQLIHTRAVHEMLSGLLQAPLPQVHLVVASRQRPHWSLARLRTLEQLHEVDATDLAFDKEESSRVMKQACPVSLSDAQIDRIQEKTEGWPAAVQLVSLAVRDEVGAANFLDRLSGADQAVAEFLVEEVLQRQPADLRQFLLGTALLKRFSAEMANHVLHITNAKTLIDQAQDLNLFLFALDPSGEWVRYHPLFAGLLAAHQINERPDLWRTLHQRAGQWLADHAMQAEAIDHALAAGQLHQAGVWLDEACPGLFASGQTATLQHYAERIPAAILGGLPRLQLEMVWEDIINWRFEKARQVLADVQRRLEDSEKKSEAQAGARAGVRARLGHRQIMMSVFTDDLDETLARAKAWPSCGAGVDGFVDASVETAQLLARRERFDCELIHGEWPHLRRRFLTARAVYGTVFVDCVAGGAMLMRAELALAESAYSQALHTAASIQGRDGNLAKMPLAQMAAVLYEGNRTKQASALLLELRDSAPEFGLVDSIIARTVIASRLASLQCEFGEAHRALDYGAHVAERYQLQRLRAHVLAERVRLLIAEGFGGDARRIVKDVDNARTAFDTVGERLATARIRVFLADGDAAEALRLARRWGSWLANRSAHLFTVSMGLLAVKAQLRLGDKMGAQRTLLDTLKRSCSGGIIRTVIDEGEEIHGLLSEFGPLAGEGRLIDASYLDLLLSSYESALPQRGIALHEEHGDSRIGSGLSPQEIDIVRLAASSFRTEDIALTLGMSESTVKWYWQRIFEKTGVRRRPLAIRLLRERGLLAPG